MNSTKRITKKVMVKLLYRDGADGTFFPKDSTELVVGREYRLVSVDGYNGYAYILVEGWGLNGYCVMMAQVGLKNT